MPLWKVDDAEDMRLVKIDVVADIHAGQFGGGVLFEPGNSARKHGTGALRDRRDKNISPASF
jgi:hypothetical protein